MDKNDFNSEIFDEVLRIVVRDYHQNEIEEYNDITEEDRHIFSPEFEKQMSAILKRGKRFKGDFKKYITGILKKSVIIILIILSVTFVSLLTVKAVREEIYKIITTFYEQFIEIRLVDTNNQNFTVDYPPEIIEETYLPSYIPDGYWEDTVLKSEHQIKTIYINGENQSIVYYQRPLSDNVNIDGEDYIENDININGMNGKIYEYGKPDEISYYIVIWNDNKYFYQLTSSACREESIKIAESVKLNK